MRQTKYLFVGGVYDGRWERCYGHPPAYRVAVRPSFWDLHRESRIVTYYAHRIVAPGWLVPLTVYTPGRAWPFAETGTAMPGWIEGAPPDAIPLDLDDDYGWQEHIRAMHAAIRARG